MESGDTRPTVVVSYVPRMLTGKFPRFPDFSRASCHERACAAVALDVLAGQFAGVSKRPVTPIAERPKAAAQRSRDAMEFLSKSHRSGPAVALNWQGLSPRTRRPAPQPANSESARGFKVAVVGATGNVGREMLDILAERRFPADEVVAVASRRSQGVEVSFADKTLKCRALEHQDFSDIDICLMSAGGAVSKEWSPKIGAQGSVVIDNSSAWRYDADVPLIVPEVNADAVAGFRKRNIIANPNCSTAQLVVALKPLHDAATIKRVVVATYQSVSGAGKDAMDELDRQTKAIYSLAELETNK